jgi:tetratricopeptide (TPR) repeat protein
MAVNLMNNYIPTPQPSFLDKLDLNFTPLELKSKYSHDQQRHYRRQYLAVIQQFRRIYSDSSKEFIQGYIAAFNHLIEVKDWDRAVMILIEPLGLYSDLEKQDLFGQLQLWNECPQIIELSEKIIDKLSPYNRLLIVNRMANAYEKLSQYESAKTSHQLSLELSKELKQSKIIVSSLLGLGNIHLRELQHKDAMKHYTEAWELAQKIDNDRLKLSVSGNIGNLFISIGDYTSAIEYLEQSIELTRKIEDKYGEAIGLLGAATARSNLGQYQLAETYLTTALLIYQDFGDRDGELAVLLNLADNYTLWKNYDSAYEYYQKSLEMNTEIKDSIDEFNAITGLGNLCYFQDNYHQAIIYFQQSRDIADRINHPLGVAISIVNIGSNAAKLGQTDLAIANLTEGFDLLQQVYAFNISAKVAYRLAEIYLDIQQFELASTYLASATSTSRELSLPLLDECEAFRLILEEQQKNQ